MGYFKRDGRDNRGSGRGFGGRGRSSERRNDSPREMFKTVCSNCGKECEVPFKPTTGKPVYCSDCFEKMGGRGGDSSRNDRFERRERPSFDRHQSPSIVSDNSKQINDLTVRLDAINTKIERIIELLTPKVEETIVKAPKLKKTKSIKEEN